jgi:nifR3 family TIM-barrel protein
MQQGFWKTLPKPFFALAPMADVTDRAFRAMFVQYRKPDVLWTEFVSADGLCSAGREKLVVDLVFDENERPIVAQLFTAVPERMERAATLVAELGFDGIDINMGCPDRSVEKQGAGAALIKDPELAVSLIHAARRGAPGLPVSVKTRTGYHEESLDAWLPRLLEAEPVALTIHARTRSELSLVPARWETIQKAVAIRDRYGASPLHTLIIGNGDIGSRADGFARAIESGADGVMVGRGAFGNPWFFHPTTRSVTVAEKLRAMAYHTKLFETLLLGRKRFDVMKKHYKAYANGFDNAKELRAALMEARDAAHVAEITETFIAEHTIIAAEHISV